MLLRVLCLWFVIFALSGMAFAQTNGPAAPVAPKTGERSFKDVPDAFFREADQFRDECGANPVMRGHYNCECLSYEYLNDRIANPKRAKSGIILDVSNKCLDASEEAGFEYQECMSGAPNFGKELSVEEYCGCYANTYAKLFEDVGRAPDSNILVDIMARTIVSCSDPEIARRIYGYVPRFKKK